MVLHRQSLPTTRVPLLFALSMARPAVRRQRLVSAAMAAPAREGYTSPFLSGKGNDDFVVRNDRNDVRVLQCPTPPVLRQGIAETAGLPHICVAGESNAGKSSLINHLLKKKLAKASSVAGKTRSVDLMLVNERLVLADLPGLPSRDHQAHGAHPAGNPLHPSASHRLGHTAQAPGVARRAERARRARSNGCGAPPGSRSSPRTCASASRSARCCTLTTSAGRSPRWSAPSCRTCRRGGGRAAASARVAAPPSPHAAAPLPLAGLRPARRARADKGRPDRGRGGRPPKRGAEAAQADAGGAPLARLPRPPLPLLDRVLPPLQPQRQASAQTRRRPRRRPPARPARPARLATASRPPRAASAGGSCSHSSRTSLASAAAGKSAAGYSRRAPPRSRAGRSRTSPSSRAGCTSRDGRTGIQARNRVRAYGGSFGTLPAVRAQGIGPL